LWDQYLFSDIQAGAIEKFNDDKSSSAMMYYPIVDNSQHLYDPDSPGSLGGPFATGNNFVIGVANSDNHFHFWQYQEDTTMKQCCKNKIPIDDYEERIITGFADGLFIKSKLSYIPWIDYSTFVYSSSPFPVTNHREFLKQFRSCGLFNKGVTASIGGGWGTFRVRKTSNPPSGWVQSGGDIQLNNNNENVELKISALSPYATVNGVNQYPIKSIRVKSSCGFKNSTTGKKILCSKTGPFDKSDWGAFTHEVCNVNYEFEQMVTVLNDVSIGLPIPNKELAFYDYIRVEIEFFNTNNLKINVPKMIAYCNPVLVKNLGDN